MFYINRDSRVFIYVSIILFLFKLYTLFVFFLALYLVVMEDVRYDEHEVEDYESMVELPHYEREEIKYAESYIFRIAKSSKNKRNKFKVKI